MTFEEYKAIAGAHIDAVLTDLRTQVKAFVQSTGVQVFGAEATDRAKKVVQEQLFTLENEGRTNALSITGGPFGSPLKALAAWEMLAEDTFSLINKTTYFREKYSPGQVASRVGVAGLELAKDTVTRIADNVEGAARGTADALPWLAVGLIAIAVIVVFRK